MDNSYENIVPWNGNSDTGRDVRLKLERNFKKIGVNFNELDGKFGTVDDLLALIVEELEKKLRKDGPDSTNFLLSMLVGAHFGHFVPGIIGAIIDKFGDGEMGSLVLRKFLSVPELRFNRVTVFKGKQIISPGGGCLIESFTLNGDGTWTIVPKLEEGEPLSQFVDDILLAYWHDKDANTGAFKGFREMKFRVTAVDYDAKTFVIVPKPNSSSVPTIAMTMAQVGNITNAERQTYIMIDSTLGNNNITFFDDCNTWDIEEHQEKSWFGKKKGRKVAGVDASAYSAVLQNIIMAGLIFQIDEISGDMVRVPCDKGAHVSGQRYAYYDRVSSAGALWLCVNEKGTSDTPADGSEDWLKQVDKGADGKPGADGIGIPGADGVTYYTWMRYADDAQGNGMSNNPIGKSYMGLAYNKLTAVESSNPADYTWSRFRGEDGKDGTDGIGVPGADGITYYTWLAYSDNADGSNMYQIPTDNTLYVGIAVNKPTAAESSNPADYTWSRFRGADGKPGADGIGIPGADGVTYYTWMRYADDAQGNGMSNDPIGKSYMGLAYNKQIAVESSNPADYTWSRFRGEDGKDGTDGIGIPGADGITYYTWLAYSDNADGSNMHQIPTDNTLYVGIAINKPTAAESSNPADYTWSRFRGTDGRPGTSITNHGAWRTAKTPIPKMGLVTMGGSSWLAKVETSNPPMWCLTDGAGNRLMSGSGYLLTGEINSAEWELLVESGADGKPGADGIGIPGADGVTYYTWMRYADDAQGNGMSNNPIGKSYMGLAYNKQTAVESSNPADYSWSLFRGEDGKDGTDGIGIPGADGITYYTWLAYSDNADGSNMYQIPTDNTLYVGIAINKPTAAESSNPADYTWSRFRGTDGRPGTSITNHGAWRTAKTPIPKMGLVTMGGSSWLAKVETSNPPMWCLTDGAGNRLMSGSGYLLTGEINSEEWELIVESGVDGKPGADGSDSTSYWLTSPISTININSIGSLSPSSVLVSCKKKKGEGTVTACSDFYLAARKYNGSWLAHVSATKSSSLSLPAVAGYTQFAVRAYNSAAEANAWGSGFVSEIGIGVVKDGSAGNDGPAGSFPRELGVFVAGTSYVWNPSYRDSILYPFDGVYYKFHVANFGATVTAAPTSASGDGLWESMGKHKSIATDTLFADGANVALFMFKNGILRSQDEQNGVPNLELNGKTGKFKGVDVELSGKIEAKEDSQIAGMRVVGNSLRGVQAIMGKYMHQITGDSNESDKNIIVNNIDRQQVYIFSITKAAQDIGIYLPSAMDMIRKGIVEYQFELTIILDNRSLGSSVQIILKDGTKIVHVLKEYDRFGIASGSVLKLFYFQNKYYLISSTSP